MTAKTARRWGTRGWNWAVYLGKDLAISLESVSRRKPWAYNQPIAAAEVTLYRGFEGVVNGETTPSVSETIAAARFRQVA